MQRKVKELQIASAGILARVMNDVADEVAGFSELSKSKYFLKLL